MSETIGVQGAKVSFINEYSNTSSTYSDSEDNYTVDLLVTEIEDKREQNTPLGYKFYQNYPNPFNPGMRIGFEIPELSIIKE